MTRDPFEELFGQSGDELAGETEQVSARDPQPRGRTEPVPTAPLPMSSPARETAAAPAANGAAPAAPPSGGGGGDDRAARAKPWIVVGIIAVIAIIASIAVLNFATADDAPEQTAEPTTQQPSTQQPSEDADADAAAPEEEPAEDEPEEPVDEDGPPAVEVGATNSMTIGPWDAESEISQRFGSVSFSIPDGDNLVLSADLLNQFPASCSGDWGATKTGDSYTVLRPQTKCAEAPEFYDEVWGLTDAWVKTIKP